MADQVNDIPHTEDQAPAPPETIAPIPVEPLLAADAASATASIGVDDIMTKDEFFIFSMGMFPIAAGVAAIGQPPPFDEPLASLTDAPKLPTARPASDAIYDLASKLPWLRFIIAKDAMWIAGLVAIGAFGFEVRRNVMLEIAQRKELIAVTVHRDEREPATVM